MVDGKKTMPEMNEDDVIGCRIKEMRDELDALQKTHGALRDHIKRLSQSLAMLLDDVIKEREASCDFLDDDIASPAVNQEADAESLQQPSKTASAEQESEEVIVLAGDSAQDTEQGGSETSKLSDQNANETVTEKHAPADEEKIRAVKLGSLNSDATKKIVSLV